MTLVPRQDSIRYENSTILPAHSVKSLNSTMGVFEELACQLAKPSTRERSLPAVGDRQIYFAKVGPGVYLAVRPSSTSY